MDTLTQIAIWNRALGFLGARSIAAEDENTPEALQCRLYWDSARRQALRDYPWAFAQRRAWLARVALPAGFEQEYRFAYALPGACLKAHEVRHEGLLPRPFCLARDPAGDATILLTSASRALLLYTEDVRHCHQFDDLFAHMLARKLACLLAAPLLKSNSQKIVELEQLYSASLPQARQSDASEAVPCPCPTAGCRPVSSPLPVRILHLAAVFRVRPFSGSSHDHALQSRPCPVRRQRHGHGLSFFLQGLGDGTAGRLDDNGGSVTYLHDGAPLPAGWKLAITRDMPFEQQIDLVSGTRFDAEVIETGLDRATAERQQLLEQLQRAVILPPTSDEDPVMMAEQLLQAEKSARASAAAARESGSAAAACASQAAASQQAAATAAEEADQSRAEAAARAAAASQSATAARQSAADAAESEDRAAQSAASILGLQVEVATLDPGLPASGDYDPETGILHLGIPKGDSGAAAIATPTSLGSVMPQTGDADGLELQADGSLRVRTANDTQRGSVLASVTATAHAVPQAGEDGTLDASWVPRPDCWDMFPPFVPVPIWKATLGGSDGRRAIMPGEPGAREEWILCDGGSDGKGDVVPDLRGRYVRGASEAEPEGSTGGSEEIAVQLSGSTGATTLSTAQMPSHAHGITCSPLRVEYSANAKDYDLYESGSKTYNTKAAGGNGSHTHPLSGSVSGTHTDPHLAMNYFIKVV